MFAEEDRERKRRVPRKKKIEKEAEEGQKSSEELTEEETYQLVSLFNSAGGGSSKPRIISLYGEIDEEQCSEISFSLLALSEMGPLYQETEKDEPRGEPIKLLISTPGGSASDMLSVYDAIRMVKPLCDVETVGLGKVMSAGVLLLAAGSKGHRKIGENCRVMIHGVADLTTQVQGTA